MHWIGVVIDVHVVDVESIRGPRPRTHDDVRMLGLHGDGDHDDSNGKGCVPDEGSGGVIGVAFQDVDSEVACDETCPQWRQIVFGLGFSVL